MKKLRFIGAGIMPAMLMVLSFSSCNNTDTLVPEASTPVPSQKVETQVSQKNTVFSFVEQMPQFPGGQHALMNYLAKTIHYPAAARAQGLSGTVVVSFIVGTDGSISDVKSATQKGGGLEEEAIRAVKLMPKWIPGKQDGKKVTVQYRLPVRFVLQ